jgi:protein HIRA/HIR1
MDALKQGDSAAAESADTNRLLATLGNHSSAVNTVRWSPDGRFLASGADDTLTMVWHLVPGQQASTPFGAAKVNNVEDWNLCVTFKGHSMDVQDLAWSPDSTKLATCSIDNKVLVWQVDKHRTGVRVEQVPIVRLDGHSGWVKGLAWDPVGRYLASTSDDKVL